MRFFGVWRYFFRQKVWSRPLFMGKIHHFTRSFPHTEKNTTLALSRKNTPARPPFHVVKPLVQPPAPDIRFIPSPAFPPAAFFRRPSRQKSTEKNFHLLPCGKNHDWKNNLEKSIASDRIFSEKEKSGHRNFKNQNMPAAIFWRKSGDRISKKARQQNENGIQFHFYFVENLRK